MDSFASIVRDFFQLDNSFPISNIQIVFLISTFLIAIPSFFYMFFSYLTGLIDSIRKNNAVKNWSTAEGVIQKSTIVETLVPYDFSGWHCEIQYSFDVDGRPFSSDRISYFNGGLGRKERAEYDADRYSLNSPVTVYYNPKNPNDCCLFHSNILVVVFDSLLFSVILVFVPMILFFTTLGILWGNLIIQILCFLAWPVIITFAISCEKSQKQEKDN